MPPEFAARSQAVVESIFDVPKLPVVFTMPSPFRTRLGGTWEAPRADANRDVLTRVEGTHLAAAAGRVAELELDIETLAPLVLRLLIGLEALDAPLSGARRTRLSTESAQTLAPLLLAELHARESALAPLWTNLSLVRRPFALTLVEELAEQPLTGLENDLLINALLHEGISGYWLHDALKGAAGARLKDDARAQAHGRLASYYERRFGEVGDAAGQHLELEVEAFHHAAAAGQDVRERIRPVFLDQLADLGRQLSEHGNHLAAADVFERAIRWNDQEAYLHHYLAYNFDVAGVGVQKIDAGYRRAIELDETHPWWHSRYVRFLITVGRIDEARAIWRAALGSIEIGALDDRIFDELHAEVAVLLIHRGHLDFAWEVLQQVPGAIREASPRFSALESRLGALAEVRDWGAFVPAEYCAELVARLATSA
jgi:hypothetical protein